MSSRIVLPAEVSWGKKIHQADFALANSSELAEIKSFVRDRKFQSFCQNKIFRFDKLSSLVIFQISDESGTYISPKFQRIIHPSDESILKLLIDAIPSKSHYLLSIPDKDTKIYSADISPHLILLSPEELFDVSNNLYLSILNALQKRLPLALKLVNEIDNLKKSEPKSKSFISRLDRKLISLENNLGRCLELIAYDKKIKSGFEFVIDLEDSTS